MDYAEYSARTVEEAITKACVDLQVTSDRLDYRVKQEASSGFFGIGSRDAIILARAKEEASPEKAEGAIKTEKTAKAAKTPNAGKKPAKEVRGTEKAGKPAEKNGKSAKTENEKNKNGKPESAPEAERTPHFKTAEEIEAMAQAAAARAAENGETFEPRAPRERRERSGGRYGRRGGRRGRNTRNAYSEEPVNEYHEPSVPKAARAVPVLTEEEIEEIKTEADAFLTDVFRTMDMKVEKTIGYDAAEGCLNVIFSGEEMGVLIGKRGQTLDSLQYLTSLAVNRNQKEYIRVKLDTEDYRSRRRETLENLSKNIAGKVRKTHRAVALEPMNPYERRIIHSALQNDHYVETYSEGEEPYRKVVIAPARKSARPEEGADPENTEDGTDTEN